MVSYNEIIENDYVLSKDGLKWIEFNKSISVLREKYPNILDDFKSFDGFAFPSSDYVTQFENLKKKVKLLQISNVNQTEWIINETQKFEYVPDKYLQSKKRYLLNSECILISLTGGTDTDNDITSYFDNSFKAFLNQRVSAFSMKEYNKDYFFYFYAMTKTKSFKEQWLGKGGIQKNTVASDRAKTYLPKIDNLEVVNFISVLTQAIINKEKLIKERHEAILKAIETELLENQKPNRFSFELPRINELEKVGRLDTSMYSYDYRFLKHKLINYTNGCKSFFNINEGRVNFKKGPNLAISVIGQSIYSDKEYASFYQLLLSKNFTKFNTLVKKEYIGNTVSLPLIQKGDFLYSCRGDMGRVLLMIDEPPKSTTNFDCAIISFPNQALYKTIYITQFLNYLREKKYVSKIAITGSGADSFTKYQFDLLDIPNFPETKQKEIALLYHNGEVEYNAETFTLANFLGKDNEYNQEVGIYELDKTAKQLKEILNQTIDKIVNDIEVKIDFQIF